jgi:hypothetical protein
MKVDSTLYPRLPALQWELRIPSLSFRQSEREWENALSPPLPFFF